MSIAHRVVAFLVVLAGAIQAQSQSFIGKGWGLDHVIVVQRSSGEARQTFGAKLGFSIVPGNQFPDQGLENGPILLPPAYLELMWVYDSAKAESASKAAGPAGLAWMLHRLHEQAGAILSYNIDVSPIEEAASFLRNRGINVTLPPSPTTLRDGKQQPGPWQFLRISYGDGQAGPPAGVPGGDRVGFLEYRDNSDRLTQDRLRRAQERTEREVPDPRRKPGEFHANTARKLESVWVAVSNVQDAVKQAESMGFMPTRKRTSAELGARGQEVQCGQGTIVFWTAASHDAALSALVTTGGLGPFGVSVGVEDLNRAHELVEQGIGQRLPIRKVDGRTRFLVPGDAAGGIWVEFVK